VIFIGIFKEFYSIIQSLNPSIIGKTGWYLWVFSHTSSPRVVARYHLPKALMTWQSPTYRVALQVKVLAHCYSKIGVVFVGISKKLSALCFLLKGGNSKKYFMSLILVP
jgi:hypothetical protein